MLPWTEWILALLLAVSQPFWGTLFPLNPEMRNLLSPLAIALFSITALLAALGLLLTLPKLRSLPRSVWNGWSTRVLGERTPSLPDLSDPLLGVVHAPLFHPRRIQAGRMLIRGMDSTAALASCLCSLLVSAALVVACLNGDAPATLLPLSLLLAASLLLWSVSIFVSIRTIGRKVSARQSYTPMERPLLWISIVPFLLLLYGFCCALIPLLSLRLDQSPISGLTAVFYALIRAAFFVAIQYLLLHGPAKLAQLCAPRKPHLLPWTFYATSGIACFFWLTIDFFHPVFTV